MTWGKSPLRRRLNSRYIRWRMSRGLVAAVPQLRARAHFYGDALPLEDAAETALWRNEMTIEPALRPDQEDFIKTRCAFDGGETAEYWRPPWRFAHEYFLVKDVWFLGHTGRMADAARGGVVLGRWENAYWNADRVGFVRGREPVDSVAMPVRDYKNYFHFMFEAALPYLAYLDGPARLPARHAFICQAEQPPYVHQTLMALAAALDVDVYDVARGEKMFCERALLHQRDAPCRDWYPTTRALADRLKSILASHAPKPAPAAERLYLRRTPGKTRTVTNGARVEETLRAAGYAVFEPRYNNFAEQVSRMGGAGAIVAGHGAALTNLLFSPAGSTVVEMFPEQFCKSVFLALAHMLGVEHRACIGGRGDRDQNFAADIERLRMLARSL